MGTDTTLLDCGLCGTGGSCASCFTNTSNCLLKASVLHFVKKCKNYIYIYIYIYISYKNYILCKSDIDNAKII